MDTVEFHKGWALHTVVYKMLSVVDIIMDTIEFLKKCAIQNNLQNVVCRIHNYG